MVIPIVLSAMSCEAMIGEQNDDDGKCLPQCSVQCPVSSVQLSVFSVQERAGFVILTPQVLAKICSGSSDAQAALNSGVSPVLMSLLISNTAERNESKNDGSAGLEIKRQIMISESLKHRGNANSWLTPTASNLLDL